MAKDHGPTIKDDERYEALRRDGFSKEAAARNANAEHPESDRKGGKAPPYDEWTREELYSRAQDIDIAGRSGMNKDELITVLRNH